jgi:hypothetical protein
MTPRQKALHLVDSFTEIDEFTIGGQKIYFHDSIKCALILVDELIQEIYNIDHQHSAVYDINTKFYNYNDCKELKYWKEVKQEIEKL